MLIISAPPMAASFFQGTMGQFYASSWFGGGTGSQPGARVGESGYRGGSTSAGNSPAPSSSGQPGSDQRGRYTGTNNVGGVNTALATGNAANTNQDTVRAGSSMPNYVYNPQTVAAERTLGGSSPTAAPAGAPLPPKGGNNNPTG
jgi:type IV secretion system protein VirB6